ncbi:nuclear envelope integral membrane protein 1-like isoform X2 [Biomphalaria glabrata]|uniref:Nuclear envelope integral membrane protein 1-like isoform X2 n=1 Tax=Biomphalaria glabrata TaxID=6526 RepID=A0A9W3BPV8_BIOGL|nr:nuclear envelope integral membrane protein 1-like isoform X2 [Biomphalaria glabrata]
MPTMAAIKHSKHQDLDYKHFLILYLFMLSYIPEIDGNNIERKCNTSTCKVVNITSSGTPSVIICVPENTEKLCILCYPGFKKSWYNMWINPKLSIILSEPEQLLEVYLGNNWSSVFDISSNVGLLSWTSFGFIKKDYDFKPFEPSCIGVKSAKNVTMNVVIKNPEIWFLFYLTMGMSLFFLAPSLSRNVLFHYSSGIGIGVLCSILIVVFIVNKFLPQKLKVLGYGIGIMSTSALLYLWRFFSDYIQEIIQNYWHILIGYMVVAGVLSFAVIYRYGPASDIRTLNLIQWTLQGIGLVFIYHGTQLSEISVVIIVGNITLYLLPVGLFSWVKRIKYRYFPPKRKLLSEEEYIIEGEIETTRALKELREYCRSPNCDAWKTLSRLNSPNSLLSLGATTTTTISTEMELFSLKVKYLPSLYLVKTI